MSDILICGSRGIRNQNIVNKAIQNSPFEIDTVIHGGAKGVDNSADIWATIKQVDKDVHKPDYDKHGKGAPLVRNKEMVDVCDGIIAIWDGKSSGTEHTINKAKEKGMEEVSSWTTNQGNQIVYLE